MSESVRKSKRLAGEEAEEPPPPSVVAAGTALKSLLAKDSKHGAPCYNSSPSRGWRLNGVTAVAKALFQETEEAFEAVEIEEAVRERHEFVDEDAEMVSSDEEEDDDDMSSLVSRGEEEDDDDDDDASTMFVPSPAKQEPIRDDIVLFFLSRAFQLAIDRNQSSYVARGTTL